MCANVCPGRRRSLTSTIAQCGPKHSRRLWRRRYEHSGIIIQQLHIASYLQTMRNREPAMAPTSIHNALVCVFVEARGYIG